MNRVQNIVARIAGRCRQLLASVDFRFSSVFIHTCLLGGVFAIQIGVAAFAIRDLLGAYTGVEQVDAATIQALQNIRELRDQIDGNRRSTLYALTTNNPSLQADYAEQSRLADRRVASRMADCLSQARTPQQAAAGKRLVNDWNNYLKIRDDILSLTLERRPQKALQMNLTSGVASFDSVRQDLNEITQLYDEQGYKQLTLMAASWRRSFHVLLIVLDFAVLFGGFAFWAIYRKQTRAALEFARLQTDFVASVSHEFRTPLSVILAVGENVRDGLAVGKTGHEHGSIIVSQATRLAVLIDQVMSFAKVTKGKLQYALQAFEVSQIINCALSNVAVLLQNSGFTVEQSIPPALPPVLADLSAVSECLENLIANAVKYSDKERWIRLSAGIDQSDRKCPGVQINVEDRGVGIPSSDLSRIFEPFYRSPQSVLARIPGKGLGLSISKGVAEAMGGRLSVISQVGVGSVFTLYLRTARTDCEATSMRSARTEVTA